MWRHLKKYKGKNKKPDLLDPVMIEENSFYSAVLLFDINTKPILNVKLWNSGILPWEAFVP